MCRRIAIWLPVVAALLAGGCAKARYVSKGPNEGIIAMPNDTPRLRKQAEKLMAAHFPEGYEIVYEYEEKVGSVTHEDRQSNVSRQSPSLTLLAASSNGGKSNGAGQVAGFGTGYFPGSTNRRTHATTTVTDKTEWRIRYRRKRPAAQRTGGEQSISHIPPAK